MFDLDRAPVARSRLVLDSGARERLWAQAEAGVEGLVAGRFHTTLFDPDEVGCAHCDYRRICRVDPVRAAAIQLARISKPGPWA